MGMSINAETRNDQGKGASRRLRRDEKVPAIVYGAGKDPINVTVSIHEITHLLENEEAFTSVLDLNLEKNKESVIVKDLQRHPAKNTITHVDFQRVDMNKTIITRVPLHFIGGEENKAIRVGAVLNQFITFVEISCLPGDLPHGIDLDITKLKLGGHLSLMDLVMPEGVLLTALQHDDPEAHNQTIVSISAARKMAEVEEDEEEGGEGEGDASGDDNAEKSDESSEGGEG
jgi:large subunit ribosomal protein L25